jgi:ABC-type lipoprotein export system ATPase subunit
MGYVPENRDIFPNLTVHQNLMLGRKAGQRQRWGFDDMYAMFPRLKERQHTEAGVMSGGEQQMLTLCRTLMGDPDLIIIDEPTEGPGAQDRGAGGRVPQEDQGSRRVRAADRAKAHHRHEYLGPGAGHGPRTYRV